MYAIKLKSNAKLKPNANRNRLIVTCPNGHRNSYEVRAVGVYFYYFAEYGSLAKTTGRFKRHSLVDRKSFGKPKHHTRMKQPVINTGCTVFGAYKWRNLEAESNFIAFQDIDTRWKTDRVGRRKIMRNSFSISYSQYVNHAKITSNTGVCCS